MFELPRRREHSSALAGSLPELVLVLVPGRRRCLKMSLLLAEFGGGLW